MRTWIPLALAAGFIGCGSGSDGNKPTPSTTTTSAQAPARSARPRAEVMGSIATPAGTPTSFPSAAAPAAPAPSASAPAPAASRPDLGPSKWAPPAEPSKPPTVAEWSSAEDIEVRNAKKLNCEVRMVREWLRVSCRTTENSSTHIKELRWLEPATKPKDFFDMVKPGTLASIVFPIRKDTNVRVEFVWDEFKRPLTIKWAPGTPKPVLYFTGDAPMDLSKPNCLAVCGLPYFPGRGTMPCPSTHDPTNGDDNGCICRAYRDQKCAADW